MTTDAEKENEVVALRVSAFGDVFDHPEVLDFQVNAGVLAVIGPNNKIVAMYNNATGWERVEVVRKDDKPPTERLYGSVEFWKTHRHEFIHVHGDAMAVGQPTPEESCAACLLVPDAVVHALTESSVLDG